MTGLYPALSSLIGDHCTRWMKREGQESNLQPPAMRGAGALTNFELPPEKVSKNPLTNLFLNFFRVLNSKKLELTKN